MRARKTTMEMAAERAVQSTCQDCKRRAVGCHADCADYSSYKKRLSKARQEMEWRNRRVILGDMYGKNKKDRDERKYKK